MKECEMIKRNLCTGCTGLAEKDWCGPEQCETYKNLKNKSGIELCKAILGIQERIDL